ncbi:hypothetical protein M0R88_02875 [Halorussus gelatinilyticus]|uniref:Uncharacterized protein n=1 Tax=Halorussus gelatinilyticus TaxID=2937524 RepID=A0A8U0IL48_9EURY|nr:DUF6663 family protein [Halorussus gelatinilyticus]UPW01052.1 hypothetical protein M0R88_02875 [Halorussus gelatinilyticus]
MTDERDSDDDRIGDDARTDDIWRTEDRSASGRAAADDGADDADSRDGDADSRDGDGRTVDADRTDDETEYRVLATPMDDGLRLLDRQTFEPVVTAEDGHDAPVGDLRPGYLVDAVLDWSSPDPTVESVSVRRPTLYVFADGIDPVFEAARETWSDARAAGDSMNSRVTRNTDNEVNGVLYVFAEDPTNGTFEAFRDGTRPVEPLVDRVNEQEGSAPREVFVLRPEGGEFVVVTIALAKGGQFADTLRETYDRPRPPEPLE